MSKVGKISMEVKEKLKGNLLTALREALPSQKIWELCGDELKQLRDRILGPEVMIWYWVAATLHREQSFAAVWNDLWTPVAAEHPSLAGWGYHSGTMSTARARISPEVLKKLRVEVAKETEALGGQQYQGRPVVSLDGSGFSMPDEEELRECFGKVQNQYGTGPYPVGRIVNLVRGGSGTVLASAYGPIKKSEHELGRQILPAIQPGDIVLGDRLLAIAEYFALIKRRGADGVMRKYDTLKIQKHPRRKIGKEDWVIELKIPQEAREREPSLPDTILLRVFRVIGQQSGRKKTLWIETTLLDPKLYPKEELAALYWQRYAISETNFDELKTNLHMDVLRSKTVQGVHREIEAHLLAHNLVRRMMSKAAKECDVDLGRISYTYALRTILKMSEAMRTAPFHQLPTMYRAMLKEIASGFVVYRPGRCEPRALRRRPKRYPRLSISRLQWRRREGLCA